jgi:hypothetical protein
MGTLLKKPSEMVTTHFGMDLTYQQGNHMSKYIDRKIIALSLHMVGE